MKLSTHGVGLAVVALAATAIAVGQFRQQHALEQLATRLDQVEQQSLSNLAAAVDADNRPVGADVAGRSRSWVTIPRPDERALENPEVRKRLIEASHAQLESTYASEPIDPAWAGTTMQAVEDAIVDVAAEGAPTPGAAQVDCRSQTCRIRLNLADHDEGSRFVDPLLAKFAKVLPMTQSVQLPAADGKGFDLFIYATAKGQ